jgi:hypothetical protein
LSHNVLVEINHPSSCRRETERREGGERERERSQREGGKGRESMRKRKRESCIVCIETA